MTYTRYIMLGAVLFAGLVSYNASAESYQSSSVLSDGKWTKIRIKQTGIYEISFDELREMGFQNPADVRIYGNGGKAYTDDIVTNQGAQCYFDDLQPIPVSIEDDRIYFFGQGVDNIHYSYNDGYFQSGGLNIYTDCGSYFLTDSLPGKVMEHISSDEVEVAEGDNLQNGWWYTYHEEDLHQGNYDNGQLFWGEDFSSAGMSRREWDAEMHNPILNKSGVIALDFYKEGSLELTLKYGLTNGKGGLNKKLAVSTNQTYFEPSKPRYASVTPQAKDNKVYVEVLGDPDGTASLDYWILSYQRSFPTLEDGLTQDGILFDGIGTGAVRRIDCPELGNHRIFQIADQYNVAEQLPSAESFINFTSLSDHPYFMVFDPTRPQLRIEGYSEVRNQNLHALAQNGADLVIFCTPELKEEAEMYADVHRNLQGLEVAVVDCASLYNEFSSGQPNPMAYRAFVSMMYLSRGHNLKNVLMFGPVTANIRKHVKGGTGESRLILHQNRKNKVAFDHGASTIYDFYGIILPYISGQTYESLKTHLGVGYITVRNSSEAEMMRKKLENYLTDSSHASTLNRILAMGCDGDNHTHEQQAIQCANTFGDSNNNASITNYIMFDDNGVANSTDLFFSTFDEGINLVQYLGHASVNMLSHDFVLTAGMVNRFHNTHLPVIVFSGCDLTLPEKQIRGIGERFVLDTPNGGIACIATNRQAWSGPNFELALEFIKKWGWDNGVSDDNKDCQRRDKAVTLGEIYSTTKSNVKNANELAYLLIGDPAIPIIGSHRQVETTVKTSDKEGIAAGCTATVSGTVTGFDGSIDTNFTGEVILRLMEPAIEVYGRDFITHGGISDVQFDYSNYQAVNTVAHVENGRFSAELQVPEYLKRYEGKNARIVASVYDHYRRIGGTGAMEFEIKSPENIGIAAPPVDDQNPVVNSISYSPERNSIVAEVWDNVAVATSTSPSAPHHARLKVDGKEISTARYPLLKSSKEDNSQTFEYSLPELSYGSHTALLTISDQAGNRESSELKFEVTPQWAQLELSTIEGVADGSITFLVSGALDNEIKLIISDTEGKEIYSTSSSGTEIEWDCRDMNGNRVTPGLYKAFVRENSKNAYKAHSASIPVPVI